MKFSTKILLLSLIISHSCNSSSTGETSIFDKYATDTHRNKIFEIAYKNNSTSPSYVVFKAKNLVTGVEKEICCEAPFLSGAMHRELNKGYESDDIKFIDNLILRKKSSVFEFRDTSALKNIRFDTYPYFETIEKIANRNDLDYYFEKYGTNDSINSMHFEDNSGYDQEVFAHIMFKCGIITSRDCIVGSYIWFGNPNARIPKIPEEN